MTRLRRLPRCVQEPVFASDTNALLCEKRSLGALVPQRRPASRAELTWPESGSAYALPSLDLLGNRPEMELVDAAHVARHRNRLVRRPVAHREPVRYDARAHLQLTPEHRPDEQVEVVSHVQEHD